MGYPPGKTAVTTHLSARPLSQVALYGNDCARPEVVEDLRGRAAKYQSKLADQPGPDQR